MTYDEYTVKVRARMQKLVRAENFIKKYRFLIIAAADIIFIAFIFTMYFAGSYLRDLSARDVVYGEEGITRAAAFLSDIKYKYTDNDTELTGLPYGAGSYEITAETKNPFGVIRQQKAALTIYKKSAFIALSDFSVEYGAEPDFKGIVRSFDLAEGDTIVDAVIEYDRFERRSDAVITSVVIKDKYSRDVTSSYELKFGSAVATVDPRKITVDTGSAEKKYDGGYLSCGEYEITEGSLAYDDELKASFHAELALPGTVSNKADIFIYNNGKDVTEKYTITERIGSLTVKPLEIKIKTASKEKEYDGEPLYCPEIEITSSELLPGHTLEYRDFPSLLWPDSVENTTDFFVVDGQGDTVDDIYEITVEKGTLTVKGRKITLRSKSVTFEYDGETHMIPADIELVSGQLYENDTVTSDSTTRCIFAGEYENKFKPVFSTINQIKAYDITYDYGQIVITKIPLVINVNVYAPKGMTDRKNKTFTADVKGSALRNTRIRTTLYIPVDVPYDEFEQYVDQRLYISHPDYSLNSKKSYDITYKITYDKDELDALRAAAGLDVDTSGQDTPGTGDTPDTSAVTGGIPELDVPPEEEYGPSGIGSGGVGGGIGNSPSPYSTLPDSTPDTPGEAVGTVGSFYEGAVYLRLRSFGNYTGTGWAEPAVYNGYYNTHPLNMTYETLLNNAYSPVNEIEVVYNPDDGLAPVPYYTVSDVLSSRYTATDVAVPADKSASFFHYDHIPSIRTDILLSLNDAGVVSDEYTDFVYGNYLALPDDTKAALTGIINEAGLDASSATVIQDVASYVRGAAEYNGAFERIPEGEDRVIYFLTKSKEGICGHFASAATLIYRALGIPARYTVGYYVVTEGKLKPAEFYAKDAHAWVEVFVDKIGWVPVEVTASSVSAGGATSVLQPPEPGSEIFYNKLIYAMASRSKVYDGEPLYSDEAELLPGSNLRQGDTVRAVTDSIKFAGTALLGSSSFEIYDENGNDVTLLYDIRQSGFAELTVLPLEVELTPLEIYVGQTVTVPSYDNALDEKTAALLRSRKISFDFTSDTALSVNKDETLTGMCAQHGYELTCPYNCGRNKTNFGFNDGGPELIFIQRVNVLPFENIRVKYGQAEKQADGIIRITGENGKIYNYLCIRSADAKKSFDGQYLYSSGHEITAGALEDGHSLEYESGSYQLYAGSADNIFSKLRITDSRGSDVTGEYIIDFYPGKLTVTTGDYRIADAGLEVEADKTLMLEDVEWTDDLKHPRVSYTLTGDKPIVRIEGGVLIGIEPGVSHINVSFDGEDLNGDGVNEYAPAVRAVTVSVKPGERHEHTGVYIALVAAVAAAGFAAVFVSLRVAKNKVEGL